MLVLRVECLPTGMTMAFGCGGRVAPKEERPEAETGPQDTPDVQDGPGDARNA